MEKSLLSKLKSNGFINKIDTEKRNGKFSIKLEIFKIDHFLLNQILINEKIDKASINCICGTPWLEIG